MSKVLGIAAVALMVVGSSAFAGEKCTAGEKSECSAEKKAECSAQKAECGAKKGECGKKKA
ncbi:hypothetical protein PDESU_06548 [Pontiella desulfatans]|uniref:Uncharacterized protein n=1 Tax=Pontiella desulfatans TaxID=2750659 RepID=A0A6C2UFH0_PONDE|nr:hypothetical protein [Pontiella desulfatans]VGO17946.1 hypothetical protein PDESU_06548 [Pontiella desulfatans]